jgi:phosphopantetheine--protein transferase-like protein
MSTYYKCGVDIVDISRIQELVDHSTSDDLKQIFRQHELDDVGHSKNRYGRLAARFAAKEACLKLFPKETANASIDFTDFSVRNNGYGAPFLCLSANASALLNLYGFGQISISLSHTQVSAMAVAIASSKEFKAPMIGKLIYWLLPIKRDVVSANLERIYSKTLGRAEIKSIIQAHYASLLRAYLEFICFQVRSEAKQLARVRVQNAEPIITALGKGRGTIVLTGHFGNITTNFAAGVANLPEARGRFYFVSRQLQPAWLEGLINRKIGKLGFKMLPKTISIESLMFYLGAGSTVVIPFDHQDGRKGSSRVNFLEHPAVTLHGLVLIAISTGYPVIPASCWMGEDGKHLLRFEEPLQLVKSTSVKEEIRLNTQLLNTILERMVLRHSDECWWMHRTNLPTFEQGETFRRT